MGMAKKLVEHIDIGGRWKRKLGVGLVSMVLHLSRATGLSTLNLYLSVIALNKEREKRNIRFISFNPCQSSKVMGQYLKNVAK